MVDHKKAKELFKTVCRDAFGSFMESYVKVEESKKALTEAEEKMGESRKIILDAMNQLEVGVLVFTKYQEQTYVLRKLSDDGIQVDRTYAIDTY